MLKLPLLLCMLYCIHILLCYTYNCSVIHLCLQVKVTSINMHFKITCLIVRVENIFFSMNVFYICIQYEVVEKASFIIHGKFISFNMQGSLTVCEKKILCYSFVTGMHSVIYRISININFFKTFHDLFFTSQNSSDFSRV